VLSFGKSLLTRIKYIGYFLEQAYQNVTIDNIDVYYEGKTLQELFEKKSNYQDFNVIDIWNSAKYL
jgi:hypothetical protein